jgi:hypothetical protein
MNTPEQRDADANEDASPCAPVLFIRATTDVPHRRAHPPIDGCASSRGPVVSATTPDALMKSFQRTLEPVEHAHEISAG